MGHRRCKVETNSHHANFYSPANVTPESVFVQREKKRFSAAVTSVCPPTWRMREIELNGVRMSTRSANGLKMLSECENYISCPKAELIFVKLVTLNQSQFTLHDKAY